MRGVAIVGVGQTPRDPIWSRNTDLYSWKDIVIQASYDAIKDCSKGLNPKDIQYIVANYHGEGQIQAGGIGPVVSEMLGMLPAGCLALCANCTGGGVGLHEAYNLIASGRYDRILAFGFEKVYDLFNDGDKRALGGDVEFDYEFGFDHPTLQALHQVYAYRTWGKKRVLRAHVQYRGQSLWFAERNPSAAYYKANFPWDQKTLFTMIDKMDDNGIFVPQEFWNVIPSTHLTDGCAAMILVPADDAFTYTDHPVYVDAVSYKSNSHLFSSQMHYPVPELKNYDFEDFGSVRCAVADSYKQAGYGVESIDFMEAYEPHVTSLIPMLTATQIQESCTNTIDFVLDGQTGYGGRLPCGTDGGRAIFGMTSGSNVGDGVVEVMKQMRGLAGERQLKKADVAMVLGMQGQMASASCAILRNSQ
jgi:acetyl-CoA C-acetyltransferase